MLKGLQILSMMLVAVAMALALAHAAEYPGKLRLDRETYFKVQTIYYPGFTIGGIGEFASLLSLALLLTQIKSTGSFRWTLACLAMIAGMQLVYWFAIHPVNTVWIKDVELSGTSQWFFNFGSTDLKSLSWEKQRNIWEWSHIARATLGTLGLLFLTLGLLSSTPSRP